MRVAFVNGWNRSLSWFFYAQGMSTPPYGMCRAATALSRWGHETHVFDGQGLRATAADLAARVLDWAPDVVVVGAFPELHLHVFMGVSKLPYDLEAARAIRDRVPRAKVLLGGYLPVRFPAETRRLAPWIDGVVAYLEDVSDATDKAGSSDGPSGATDAGVDWALLTPDFRTYGVDRWLHLHPHRCQTRPVLPIITATGCPHRCSFCATPVHFDHRYRPRPVEVVLAELEAGVRTTGVRAWSVWDDTFTVRSSRVAAFCDGLLERELDVRWWCFGHASWVARNEALLERMRAAGCRMMWLGVESVDSDRQQAYHKGTDASEALRAVEALLRRDILPTTSFLLGEPDETRETLERRLRATERFLRAGALNVYTLLIPVPGTELFAELAAADRLLRGDLRLYSGARAVVRYPDLEPAVLEDAFFSAYAGSVLSREWVDAFGRANLFADDTRSVADDPPDESELQPLARQEFERMGRLERAAGMEVDACHFRA